MTLDAKLPATERVNDFEGIVICGRPRLARGFMSVCAIRSSAVICPTYVRGSMAAGPDDIRGLIPFTLTSLML